MSKHPFNIEKFRLLERCRRWWISSTLSGIFLIWIPLYACETRPWYFHGWILLAFGTSAAVNILLVVMSFFHVKTARIGVCIHAALWLLYTQLNDHRVSVFWEQLLAMSYVMYLAWAVALFRDPLKVFQVMTEAKDARTLGTDVVFKHLLRPELMQETEWRDVFLQMIDQDPESVSQRIEGWGAFETSRFALELKSALESRLRSSRHL